LTPAYCDTSNSKNMLAEQGVLFQAGLPHASNITDLD
jgi:hypothetical protein